MSNIMDELTRNNELITMSCNHKFDKDTIIKALEKTFSSKYNCEIKCPQRYCNKFWSLDECSDAVEMDDALYTYYLEQIEDRTSPKSKQCPFCYTDCQEPKKYNGHCVICSCNRAWCWLCQQPWRTQYNDDCGNSKCELNAKKYNNNHLSKDDIKMKDINDKNQVKDGKDINNLNEANEDCDAQDDFKDTTQSDTKKNNNSRNKGKKSKKEKKNDKNKKNDEKKKKKVPKKQMGNGLIGLSNLGNTCFMNSALQCLLQCPAFVEAFFYNKVKLPTTTNRWRKTIIDDSSISYIWSQFIKEIYTTKYGSISPRNIKNALNRLNPDIGNGSQEDSFCVIETLLQGLDEELCTNNDDCIYDDTHINDENDIPSQEEIENDVEKLWSSYTNESNGDCTIIRQLFEGIECEKLTCPDCNYQLRAYQQFRHIQLPLCNKNIKINIKVFVPEVSEYKSIPLNLDIAFDNTADGLEYIVLSQIKDKLTKNKIDKDLVQIKFGYYHPSNNNQSNDVNKWIKYMNNDGNCAKIKNYCGLFAVVYRSNNCDDYKENDDNNNNPKNENFQFIPTFNLIVTEEDQWGEEIDTLTFTVIKSSCKMVSGKELIHHASNVSNRDLEKYNLPIIYYNNHLVTDDTNHKVKITKTGCLLRIWIHPKYRKRSPGNVKINMDANDKDIIQRALQQKSASISRGLSMEYIMDTLYHYYTKLTCFDLCDYIPGYNMNDNQEAQKKIENEKSNAESVYNKLKKLSESEKLANKWLRMKINGIKKSNEKNDINYTKPKMLDNVTECLKVYEMKETSDGNGVDCQRCRECPKVASREVDIIKTPQILTIHIDREQTDFSGVDSSRKRDNLITYPIKDLKFKNDKYNLFGVVEHYGYGTNWGHYVCYVKSLKDQKWYKMNDGSRASEVYRQSNVITKDASVLLYEKQKKIN